MILKTYQKIFEIWKSKKPNQKIWTDELAKDYGFSSSEALRSAFRRAKRVYNQNIVGNNKCKILLFDVETSPINALVWGIWEQNIRPEAILQDWHLFSWAGKWLFDDNVYSDVLTKEEALKHDDFRIVQSAWEIMNQADIIVTHNGDFFDVPRMNTRFLFHSIMPLSHCKSVDTLKVAKSAFSFTSRKLDYINSFLGISQKTETDFELWKRCYFGDEKSLKELVKYNRNDVCILEETFLKMRPYIKNFPNLNLYDDREVSVCRNCASENISWSGYYYTNVSKYKGWRCDDCGAVGRSRFPESFSNKKKKSVIV